jgi:23S rRNA (uracil1939-C5)-methyltransferase
MSTLSRPPSAVTTGGLVACEHAARCGGCPLIDQPYDAQLARKAGHVAAAFAAYPALAGVAREPVVPADPIVAYRTRAKLIVGPEGEVGLFARGGAHEVVDIPRCRVLAPVLSSVAEGLRARIAHAASAGGALAPTKRPGGSLRAVDLREVRDDDGSARTLVTWVFDRDGAPDNATLRRAAEDLVVGMSEVAGVAANFQTGGAAQVLGNDTVHLAGARTAADRAGASRPGATFGSFVQAHRGQAARIHEAVAAAVGAGPSVPRVLDLYGGSGAIALGLAARGARVLLVESFGPAAAQAAEAARAQGLDVQTEHADAARAVDALVARGESFDAVVLNPPRRGAAAAVRLGIARLAPETVVYVSCDPRTLARDLDHLAALGYRPSSLRPFDMIPLTEQVEVVAVLARGAPPPPRVLYEDDQVLVVDKGPHEPVLPDVRARGSLAERVCAYAGAASTTVALGLEPDASGIVVFVRDAADVDAWRRALCAAQARVDHVVGVRGILRARGTIVRPLRGARRPAPPRVRHARIAVFGSHSLARATADVPGTDAIRAHLASVGHPVLGDARFGDRATNRHFVERAGLDRAFLHRARVELAHPVTGAHLLVEAPLPGDLQAVIDRYATRA